MSDFNAYANDDDVLNIEGDALTVSNGTTRVVIAGTLEIARDRRGLKAALALKQAVDAIVTSLQGDSHLPQRVDDEPPTPTGTVDNPFA
ncbi:hypothetical protein WKR88_17275 [Trinickia caryophylli]|uniref:Uncharacterized protein n=1 Tax=Trinickia caryophylli TaxID=28094 RepID=A0A1X7G4Q3_TRICW|nr:hypothetical protein [Trinickia caryophylli]PMS13739.1 hypothetical protein C0Z17_02315 [Trinickia caryophylli]TRX14234.1 hypothetical protein FNF07_23305 [Trinickia caryophylli]WQE14061.1 hypothetical protein U0034_25515 [Trinickia caryophylli]SMF63226.1 hypothetical protein SAMN06295900_11381 [Trinickia caryophylli]GLU33450.1 hypothetical protein Busp01_32920 [Trinickia caryophylli]